MGNKFLYSDERVKYQTELDGEREEVQRLKILQASYLLQYGRNQEFLLDIKHAFQMYCAYMWGLGAEDYVDRQPIPTEEQMKESIETFTVPYNIRFCCSQIVKQNLVDDNGKPRKKSQGLQKDYYQKIIIAVEAKQDRLLRLMKKIPEQVTEKLERIKYVSRRYLGLDFSYEEPFRNFDQFDIGNKRAGYHLEEENNLNNLRQSITRQALKIKRIKKATREEDDHIIPRIASQKQKSQWALKKVKGKWKRVMIKRKDFIDYIKMSKMVM